MRESRGERAQRPDRATGCHPRQRLGIESVREKGQDLGEDAQDKTAKQRANRVTTDGPRLLYFAVWWPHSAVGGSQSRTTLRVHAILGHRRLAAGQGSTGPQGTLGLLQLATRVPLCLCARDHGLALLLARAMPLFLS